MATIGWQWVLTADALRVAGVAAGVGLLVALAAIDRRRRGRAATRWQELVFLLMAVAGAATFAVVHDQVTVTISPEYFAAHEGLSAIPADVRMLALGVAVRGSWWVGLIVGTVLLLANNPRGDWPRLGLGAMVARLTIALAGAACGSAALGLAAWAGAFDAPPGLEGFTIVGFAHLGAYLGGGVGMLAAAGAIVARRLRLRGGNAGSDSLDASHIMDGHERHDR